MTGRTLNLLVVDDEPELRELITRSFRREGHRVAAVSDGAAALELAGHQALDLMLLDVALRGQPDGFQVCRTLRERNSTVPIIMLTALDSEADIVLGLESGADDYVTKPFGVSELRSRIRAVLRRAGPRPAGEDRIVVGRLVLDRTRRDVAVDGRPVQLTFSEFELMQALIERPLTLRSRQELLRAIWGDSAYRDPRAIDVHVRRLREKLDPRGGPSFILTVRGAGYRLQAD
jgi:DNA-binding response OmpR family regulator